MARRWMACVCVCVKCVAGGSPTCIPIRIPYPLPFCASLARFLSSVFCYSPCVWGLLFFVLVHFALFFFFFFLFCLFGHCQRWHFCGLNSWQQQSGGPRGTRRGYSRGLHCRLQCVSGSLPLNESVYIFHIGVSFSPAHPLRLSIALSFSLAHPRPPTDSAHYCLIADNNLNRSDQQKLSKK